MSSIRKSMLVVTLSLMFGTTEMFAQPRCSVQLGAGGLSLHWLSVMLEVNAFQFPKEFVIQSLRISSGYGLPMFNAQYLPVEMRLVGLQGTNHIEAVIGCNIQVRWTEGADDGWRDFASSALNPTAALVYRFEPEDGGFFFRLGVGCVYMVTDQYVLPCGTGGFGIAF